MRQFRVLRISVEMLADMLGISNAAIVGVDGREAAMFGTIDITVHDSRFPATPPGTVLRVGAVQPTVTATASPEFASAVRAMLFADITEDTSHDYRRNIQLDSPESAT